MRASAAAAAAPGSGSREELPVPLAPRRKFSTNTVARKGWV